jgi:DNA-binding transcriptional MerR regulator
MTVTIPDKNYFRIGEVGKILGVETYVVRYWESEFKTVKPARTKSDQRLYRRKDVEELLAIKNLLYQEKFTIAGAKKRLAELKRDTADSQKNLHDLMLVEIKRELKEIRKMLG